MLIDICNAIIKAEAEGRLKEDRYRGIATQADIIVGASAKAGIQGLVYRLAGYNPTAEEVISAFKAYVQEEAKRYEPQFDDALYAERYQHYDIPDRIARGHGIPNISRSITFIFHWRKAAQNLGIAKRRQGQWRRQN